MPMASAAISKETLDFLVIGAQKSGTTTLFEHLRHHPGLAMPGDKEAPFFTRDDDYRRGVAWFTRENFARQAPAKLWGKVSPQYMADPRAAARIASALPGIRLVAILRDPVARALSHYRMMMRRGVETRSFPAAVADLVEPGAARRARLLPAAPSSETSCYLAWGEYGRILRAFLDHHDRESLLVVFSSDLQREPAGLLRSVLSHIGADPHFEPPNLGQEFHRGGSRTWVPWLPRAARSRPVQAALRQLPPDVRRRLVYQVKNQNVRVDPAERVEIAATTRALLRDHYLEDRADLVRRLGVSPPW